tara:strand:- start:753 stop:1943 length:1191 start_codon:yes stop_codon:yes gene_type:complete
MINLLYFDNEDNNFFGISPSHTYSLTFCLKQLEIEYEYIKYQNHNKGFLLFNLLLIPSVTPEIKNILSTIKNTNIKILLYHGGEGMSYYGYYEDHKFLWNTFITSLIDFQIVPERIYYITSDLKLMKSHNEYYDKMNKVSINYYEFACLFRNNTDLNLANPYWKKNKLFLSLNSTPRPGRQVLYYYLKKNNLIKDNYFSFLWNSIQSIQNNTDDWYKYYRKHINEFNYDNTDWSKEKFSINDQIYLDDYYTIPEEREIPLNNRTFHQDRFLPDWYNQSVFSLVTECATTPNILYLTEKIYKPLMIGHPFLVWGSPGTLAYLRSQGYQTFPELFDESYDNLDEKNRLKLIIENVKNSKVEQYTPQIIEKIEYNKQLFLKQNEKLKNKKKLERFLNVQ